VRVCESSLRKERKRKDDWGHSKSGCHRYGELSPAVLLMGNRVFPLASRDQQKLTWAIIASGTSALRNARKGILAATRCTRSTARVDSSAETRVLNDGSAWRVGREHEPVCLMARTDGEVTVNSCSKRPRGIAMVIKSTNPNSPIRNADCVISQRERLVGRDCENLGLRGRTASQRAARSSRRRKIRQL
jgi:hypothetical protein